MEFVNQFTVHGLKIMTVYDERS